MIKVDLLDTMGSDLSVVNAARVSFNKESTWEFDWYPEYNSDYEVWLSDRDTKLIQYLAKHDHWSPFAHCFLSFRIKAPIFVARQLAKHQVGLSWNEVSRRYVDDEPEFYVPEKWRKRADNVKQGSSDEAVSDVFRVRFGGDVTVSDAYANYMAYAEDLYKEMLEHGVAPEQARMVLPQSTMTEWIWSGSLMAFIRVCKLRLDPHTQQETREVAALIADYLEQSFPVSYNALMDTSHG